MSFKESMESISRIIRKSSDVNIVFGSNREVSGRTIIPVCAVKYGFGAGSGKHAVADDEESGAEGGGGGGGISNEPLGVFEITEERICFKPVINFNHVLKIMVIWIVINFLKRIFRPRL